MKGGDCTFGSLSLPKCLLYYCLNSPSGNYCLSLCHTQKAGVFQFLFSNGNAKDLEWFCVINLCHYLSTSDFLQNHFLPAAAAKN